MTALVVMSPGGKGYHTCRISLIQLHAQPPMHNRPCTCRSAALVGRNTRLGMGQQAAAASSGYLMLDQARAPGARCCATPSRRVAVAHAWAGGDDVASRDDSGSRERVRARCDARVRTGGADRPWWCVVSESEPRTLASRVRTWVPPVVPLSLRRLRSCLSSKDSAHLRVRWL